MNDETLENSVVFTLFASLDPDESGRKFARILKFGWNSTISGSI